MSDQHSNAKKSDRIMDGVLLRMLDTPPVPHDKPDKKRQAKKTPKKKPA